MLTQSQLQSISTENDRSVENMASLSAAAEAPRQGIVAAVEPCSGGHVCPGFHASGLVGFAARLS